MEGIQNGSLDCPSLIEHPRTKTQSSVPDTIRKAETCFEHPQTKTQSSIPDTIRKAEPC